MQYKNDNSVQHKPMVVKLLGGPVKKKWYKRGNIRARRSKMGSKIDTIGEVEIHVLTIFGVKKSPLKNVLFYC